MVVPTKIDKPLLSKHVRGYILDGHQTRIACIKFPAGIGPFTRSRLSTVARYITQGPVYATILKDYQPWTRSKDAYAENTL